MSQTSNHVLGAEPAIALERGEVLYYPVCPFPLPAAPDRPFLREQRLASAFHKNIAYDPRQGRVTGLARRSSEQAARLRCLMAEFSSKATAWLAGLLPGYARAWQLDRATLRTEEEATRRLRPTARNDLLHVDAFPSRPSFGRRILRLFVNLNETEPRVWVTSESFRRVLEQFGKVVGLPAGDDPAWTRLGDRMLRLFSPTRPVGSAYDAFMWRLHNHLKSHDEFQERAPRRFWKFAPGSAWLLFTDGLCYAELRGQFALEHSYFIARETLALPDEAPAALLAREAAAAGAGRAA